MRFVHLHEFPYETDRGTFTHFAAQDGVGREELLCSAKAWCEEQFGPASYYRDPVVWCQFGWSIVFGEHDHAMAFKLRWC